MLQSDIILIPKSKHIERMEQNFDVFDFELSDEDMKNIATLDRGKSIFGPEYGPHTGKVLYFLSTLINKSWEKIIEIIRHDLNDEQPMLTSQTLFDKLKFKQYSKGYEKEEYTQLAV